MQRTTCVWSWPISPMNKLQSHLSARVTAFSLPTRRRQLMKNQEVDHLMQHLSSKVKVGNCWLRHPMSLLVPLSRMTRPTLVFSSAMITLWLLQLLPVARQRTPPKVQMPINNPPSADFLRETVGFRFFLDATSDPLQQAREHTTSESAGVSSEVVDVEENSSDRRNRLRKAIADTTLSITPFTHYSLPYLETAEGSACQMRVYFQRDMYQSPSLDRVDSGGKSRHASTRDVTNGTFGNYHRLLFTRQHSLFHCNIVDRANATPMKVCFKPR
jgi:hypothetical protein